MQSVSEVGETPQQQKSFPKSIKMANHNNNQSQEINSPSTTTSVPSSPLSQPSFAKSSKDHHHHHNHPFFTGRLIKSSYLGLRQLKKRYIILMLCMMINALSYTIRTDINLTIVAMVRDDNSDLIEDDLNNYDDSCPNVFEDDDRESFGLLTAIRVNHTANRTDAFLGPTDNNEFLEKEKYYESLFDWSESLQGTIVGAYYYGYILTNFNGGQMSEWIGTKRLLTISMAISAIFTLVIPMAAYIHPWLLIVVRILTGIAQGVVTPAIYQLLSYWTPRNELGLAFGLIPASGYLGAVITMPICAFLSESTLFGGWPSVFYGFGLIGLVSLIPWWLFVYDFPNLHPTITEDELNYIQSNAMTTNVKKKGKHTKKNANSWVPWCSIISSAKIWAITVTKFCTAWGNLFLMSKLPTYLSQILHMPITYNSYVNASIYIALGGSMFVWGAVADWVERRQCLSRTRSRKLFETLALLGSAAFMAAIPLAGCDILPIIIMLNLSMITLGLTAGGDSLIIVDVAPDFSGSIYGFSNSIASLPGFLAPLFVGLMLDQPGVNQMHQWSLMFWIGSGIYLFGAIVFLLFVDSNVESWGRHVTSSGSSVIKSPTKSGSILESAKKHSEKDDSRLEEESSAEDSSVNDEVPESNPESSATTTTIIQVEPDPTKTETESTEQKSHDSNDSDVFYIRV